MHQIFKTVLEAQAPIIPKKPWDKSLKARFSNMYYENSHMKYYNSCQQCTNYIFTARAKGANQILFVASVIDSTQ